MINAKTASLIAIGLLLGLGSGCRLASISDAESDANADGDVVEAIATNPTPAPALETATPATEPSAAPDPAPDNSEANYQRGLEQATQAANLGQVAQSRDDWRLAAAQWQRAIELMQTIPASSANYATAQAKIPEYQRNLAVAEQQANRPIVNPSPSPAATASRPAPPPVAPATVAAAPVVQTPQQPAPQPVAAEPQVFRAPIVRRIGGTPVVNARFNGNRSFPMIVDTGASGTVITQQMAAMLGVVPVGQARVNTASATNVAFPLGYVNSVEVAGTTIDNVLVAVAGPQLSVGLLGQDFFQNFDVTIREQEVEFRPR
ncbi:MAG: retropepsin-like aspartic protease [Cyanobacteria bacterium J06638_22]